MNFILRLVLRLAPETRRTLKRRFPTLAQKVLSQSYNLKKWHSKQFKLRREFDQKANALSIASVVGSESAPHEIVLVTPTAPTKNGIAVYSFKLAEELKTILQVRIVTTFLGKGEYGFYPGVRAGFPEISNEIVRREILYMLGNGEHHWRTWELILEKSGYILIHDARIPDIPVFEVEDPVWGNLDYFAKADKFLGRLPIHIKGIFTHSHDAADIVRKQLNASQLDVIPIYVLGTGHPADVISAQKVYPKKNPVIGTFGFQSANKNPRLTYSVIAHLAAKTSGKGVVCGNIDDYHKNLAKRIWLNFGNKPSDLEIHSWVGEAEYEQIMSNVDMGVQLRTSSNGESSGPFTQLTSRGIPTVVSDIGTFSEFPNLSGVLKLPLVISKVDFPRVLNDFIALLGSEEAYISSSKELKDYYRSKTYFNCASEIYEKIFE